METKGIGFIMSHFIDHFVLLSLFMLTVAGSVLILLMSIGFAISVHWSGLGGLVLVPAWIAALLVAIDRWNSR